jgi:hypothetical protein
MDIETLNLSNESLGWQACVLDVITPDARTFCVRHSALFKDCIKGQPGGGMFRFFMGLLGLE